MARLGLREAQCAVDDRQVGSRRDDVEMVTFDGHSLRRLKNRHCCGAGQQLHHHAFVRGIEVLYQDEGHAVIGGQCGEKSPACVQPPRRGANPDDWEIS